MFSHIGTTAKKALAVATAFVLGTGLTLAGAGAASAETVWTSYGQGQFLSGSLFGNNLDKVVALEGVEAYNDGTQNKVTEKDPLHATVLSGIDVTVPGGIQADLGDFLDAGVINEYAEADKDGKSMASSGAIGDDGAIGVGAIGGGAAGDLDLDLSGRIGSSYAALLSELKLSLEAVAAQAVGNKGDAYGDYTLAGATLSLKSPAIAHLTEKVLESLKVVDSKLASLTGSGGGIALQVVALVKALNADLLGANADVSVSITTDLVKAVTPLLSGNYGEGAISFNLQSGAIEIDLEALLGGNLNDLPPNTELIDGVILTQVFKGITDTIDDLIDDIVFEVDKALHQAKLDVHVGLDVEVPLLGSKSACTDITADVLGPAGATVDQVLRGLVGGYIGGESNGLPFGQVLAGSGLDHLVGGILNGGLGGLLGGGGTTTAPQLTYLGTTVVDTVCSLVPTVLELLNTSLTLDIEGTVSEILAKKAATTTLSLVVLGQTVNVPLADILGILGGLGITLDDGLFGDDGAIQDLLDALNLNLLDPAMDGLLGDKVLNITGLGLALEDILSIKVNVQERFVVGGSGMAITQPGSYFTETAVRVSLLSGDLAVVNLAAATVGPNINRVIDPEDPDCTVNCGPGGPGDPGDPTSSGRGGNLAMTGVGIATLVAVILALLAAGAYLAREGYRKNHQQA